MANNAQRSVVSVCALKLRKYKFLPNKSLKFNLTVVCVCDKQSSHKQIKQVLKIIQMFIQHLLQI